MYSTMISDSLSERDIKIWVIKMMSHVYSQEMSDLSFKARQCCLVNPILSNQQFIFKCHGEITKTHFAI